jgi:DMSO/TMAO reductase YedYZ molybdopterin-dependent catalytic subunit
METSSRRAGWLGFVAGGVAAVLAVLALLVLRVALGGPSLPEILQEGIVQRLPGALFSAALDQLRFAGKPLLFGSILIGMVVVGGGIGAWYARRERSVEASALIALAAYLLVGLVLLPAFGAGVFGGARQVAVPVWLTTAVATLVFSIALHALIGEEWAEAPERGDRRRVLRLAGGGVALGALGLVGWRAVGLGAESSVAALVQPPPPPPPDPGPISGDDHVTPEITSAVTFYGVSKNFVDPVVKLDSWKLTFEGMVERPYSLSYDELRALPMVEQPATLCCISNEVGGDLMGNAVWKGVRFADLLHQAGVKPGAAKVAFQCRDDYRDSIALDRALMPGTMLAYEMNGTTLTDKHGFPVRLIVPGIYGMKNVKWLEKVELVSDDFRGFWQQQGWSDRAPYLTTSRIDAPLPDQRPRPNPTVIQGVAFAGDRGIQRVEVSADSGQTWRDAKLRPAMGPFTWVRWSIDWPTTAGVQIKIMVRATDGTGQLQTQQVEQPYPEGATGWHTISVRPLDA